MDFLEIFKGLEINGQLDFGDDLGPS